MAFHVGQKVVCVRDDWHHIEGPGRKPEVSKGEVYTVRKIQDWNNNSYLYFCETVAGYRAGGFRPVVERKTDISVFLAMLTPSKSKQPERV